MVEDDPNNLRLYKMMLTRHNYQIHTAENGKECLEIARKCLPELILMDWNMPVMDGIETLRLLKRDVLLKRISVLMITGIMTSSKDLNIAMLSGAVDFLKKPFDELELTARIRNILSIDDEIKSLETMNQSHGERNQFVASILESIPQPVLYSNAEGIIVLCNQSFAKSVGKRKEVLIGKSAYRFGAFEDVEFHVNKDFELIETGEMVEYELCNDHENKVYSLIKNVVKDFNGNTIGIVTIFTDITEQKKERDDLFNLKKVELISSTLKLLQLSESHNSLIEELNTIVPHTCEKGIAQIRRLQKQYKLKFHDQIREGFDFQLESAFDSFFQKLRNLFPGLTVNERKLCALLRSGMSSKEIAMITFQNPSSVDMARYRLRKKFKLASHIRLSDFLFTIDK